MEAVRPFWSYYGAKYRSALKYPAPIHDTIIEPFAGAAGYSLRYHDRYVVLVETYPLIAELWRYLIRVTAAEIRAIPLVNSVDDLPSWVPIGGRTLVGFLMNDANVSPRKTLSQGIRRHQAKGYDTGWCAARRNRVATQVDKIRHWTIIEGDYTKVPTHFRATWFVDPPYAGAPGRHYVHNLLDYSRLGEWCQALAGQVMVCENAGATWLPFVPFANFPRAISGKCSEEVLWYRQS